LKKEEKEPGNRLAKIIISFLRKNCLHSENSRIKTNFLYQLSASLLILGALDGYTHIEKIIFCPEKGLNNSFFVLKLLYRT